MSRQRYSQSLQNLRTIAVIGVVFHHAAFGIYRAYKHDLPEFFYLQLVNYGSILFMLISGYLFEGSIRRYPVRVLVKKKIRTIVLPYLLFVTPWFFFEYFIGPYYGKQKGEDVNLGSVINTVLFQTNYWFIINLILVQSLNFLIIEVSRMKWLIVVFTLITLFYSANIYLGLVESAHSYAFLGFVSFFFCGRLVFRFNNMFHLWYERMMAFKYYRVLFLALFVVLYLTAIREALWIHRNDPYTDFCNVLRLSNILFTALLLIIFYRKRKDVNFGKGISNKSVFLIYLIHPYVIRVGTFLLNRFDLSSLTFGLTGILMNILFGAVILISSWFAARTLLSWGFLR